MSWIDSNGGPLCLIPKEFLSSWGGCFGGRPPTDYDSACEALGDIAILGVGGGGGSALVLGGQPLATAWHSTMNGGALLRWVYGSSEGELRAGALQIETEAFPCEPKVVFVTGPSGECILFDAAEPGVELVGPHLTVHMAPGAYCVDTILADIDDENRLLVHRVRKERS